MTANGDAGLPFDGVGLFRSERFTERLLRVFLGGEVPEKSKTLSHRLVTPDMDFIRVGPHSVAVVPSLHP
jgi:hypothetical protein